MARCEDPIRVMKGRHGGDLGYRVTVVEGFGQDAAAHYYYPGGFNDTAYQNELERLSGQIVSHTGQNAFDVEKQIEMILRSGESVPLPPASPTE